MAIVLDGTGSITGLTSGAGIAAAALSGQVPDANAPSGSVIQVVSANPTLSFSTTSGTFASIGLSASITPLSASSKIFIVATFLQNAQSSNLSLQTALFRGATQLDITTGEYAASAGWLQTTNTTTFLDSPATTASTTYTVQARVSAGAGTLSFTDKSSIVLMEIAA